MPGQGSSSSSAAGVPSDPSRENQMPIDVEDSSDTPRLPAQKGAASKEAETKPRTSEPEALFCQATLDNSRLYNGHVESLKTTFLQKRAQKELPTSGNSPELQSQIDEEKVAERETIQIKAAVKIW